MSTTDPSPPAPAPEDPSLSDSDTEDEPDSTVPYLSSQLRTLFHFQHLLSQQLHQARQEVHPEAPDTPSTEPNASSEVENNAERVLNEEHGSGGGGGGVGNGSPSSSSMFDLQVGARWLEQATAFIGLLLILALYHHRNGILVFIFNTIVFTNANQSLKKQVALKDKRSVWALTGVIFGLVCHIFFMYLFLHGDKLWYSLVLKPPSHSLDIWTVFWIIVINDFFVRFFTMIVKACVVIAVGHKSPHKRKAQLYTIIEMASYTYRTLLPIPIWFHYFYTFDENGQLFSSLMAGLYLACKFINMVDKFRQFFATVRAYILREVKFGRYASGEQVAEVGDMCPICQEKMISPIVLRCTHIFCEDCVSEWFERERTCPLCRAAVPTAGNLSHSDGSTSMLVQLF